MNIHEYQAKQLFQAVGIPVPEGRIAESTAQAIAATEFLGGQAWVVKAQVHAGGRGKVGGVKLLNSVVDVAEFTEKLLNTHLVTQQTGSEGFPINSVWVEKPSAIKR